MKKYVQRLFAGCTKGSLNSVSRKEYMVDILDDQAVQHIENPFELFKAWMNQAIATDAVEEPTAMCLSTSISHPKSNLYQQSRPSSRMVLLKQVEYPSQLASNLIDPCSCESRGSFVWFTNYESKKGVELEKNPWGALTFWWPALQRQIHIRGRVEKLEAEKSDEYFAIRPRGSQLSVYASRQSKVVNSRIVLDKKWDTVQKEHSKDSIINRPTFWGGYRLLPDSFEFWQGRNNRFHDRIQFSVVNDEVEDASSDADNEPELCIECIDDIDMFGDDNKFSAGKETKKLFRWVKSRLQP